MAAGVLSWLVGGRPLGVGDAGSSAPAPPSIAAPAVERLEDLEVASFYRRDLAEASTRLPGVTASWIGTAMVGRVVGDELRYVSLAAGLPCLDDLGVVSSSCRAGQPS